MIVKITLSRGQVDKLAKHPFSKTYGTQRRPHHVVTEDHHIAFKRQVQYILVCIPLLGSSVFVLDKAQEAKFDEAIITGR